VGGHRSQELVAFIVHGIGHPSRNRSLSIEARSGSSSFVIAIAGVESHGEVFGRGGRPVSPFLKPGKGLHCLCLVLGLLCSLEALGDLVACR